MANKPLILLILLFLNLLPRLTPGSRNLLTYTRLSRNMLYPATPSSPVSGAYSPYFTESASTFELS